MVCFCLSDLFALVAMCQVEGDSSLESFDLPLLAGTPTLEVEARVFRAPVFSLVQGSG